MCGLIRVKIEGDIVIYEYHPECKEDYGLLGINTRTGEVTTIRKAKTDEEYDTDLYAYMGASGLFRMHEKGEYPEHWTVQC